MLAVATAPPHQPWSERHLDRPRVWLHVRTPPGADGHTRLVVRHEDVRPPAPAASGAGESHEPHHPNAYQSLSPFRIVAEATDRLAIVKQT